MNCTTESPLQRFKDFSSLTGALLASYYTLILLVCWIGNGFVLHATVKHRALNLGKMSVWIIQNLCVADILHGVFHLLPATIALSTDYDLRHICKPLLIVKYMFIDMNSFLINALVFNKIFRCMFPFKPQPGLQIRLLVPLAATVSGSIYSVVNVIKARLASNIRFQDNYLGCEPDHPLPQEYETMDLALTCVVLVIPVATLIVGNTTLLLFAWIIGSKPPESLAKTCKQHINKTNFLIIMVTTLVYTLAQLPYLYFIFEVYGITRTLSGIDLVSYMRFSFVIMQTSCFINPIIYFLTNKGFRDYTLGFLKTKRSDATVTSSVHSIGGTAKRKIHSSLDALVIENRNANQTANAITVPVTDKTL